MHPGSCRMTPPPSHNDSILLALALLRRSSSCLSRKDRARPPRVSRHQRAPVVSRLVPELSSRPELLRLSLCIVQRQRQRCRTSSEHPAPETERHGSTRAKTLPLSLITSTLSGLACGKRGRREQPRGVSLAMASLGALASVCIFIAKSSLRACR